MTYRSGCGPSLNKRKGQGQLVKAGFDLELHQAQGTEGTDDGPRCIDVVFIGIHF